MISWRVYMDATTYFYPMTEVPLIRCLSERRQEWCLQVKPEINQIRPPVESIISMESDIEDAVI